MAVQNAQQPMLLTGLTAAQVEESRRLYGSNILTPPKRDPWWKLYLEKYQDPIIRILIIAAAVTLIVGLVDGHFAEGIGIIIAILLSTTLAFVNEYRAKREFDVLNRVNDDAPTQVIRDGAFIVVGRKDLVVGDVVLIEAGDEVPADGELIEAVSLQVNESLLTGESLAVSKVIATGMPRQHEAFPKDQVFRSTLTADGRGAFRVTAVGDHTKIGEIAREAIIETDEVTPLNAQLERLSKLIGVVGFAVAAITYVALVIRGALVGDFTLTTANGYVVIVLAAGVLIAGVRIWLPILYDALELAGRDAHPPRWLEAGGTRGLALNLLSGAAIIGMGILTGRALNILPPEPNGWLEGETALALLRFFMVSVTIIVVAVPEGLPMSVTLSLAYSMRRMTATNNLVRRMQATETVGAATVICSDKTGTLTLNQMRVREWQFPGLGDRTFTGDLNSEAARLTAESMSANSTANLTRAEGEPTRPIGDGTEGALLLWLDENGVDYLVHRANFKILAQLTFSSERKYMATLGESAAQPGKLILHVKGAPEVLLDQSMHVQLPDGRTEPMAAHRAQIDEDILNYARRGMRTLGFAYRQVAQVQDELESLAHGLIWLGYVAIADPIRPEVPPAVQACRKAGIKVKVVTGDNPETAKEIARQIGLWLPEDDRNPTAHLLGRDFEAMSDDQAKAAVADLKVLSRARPLDKMRLVRLLQENGEIVAVTGDGTNDAPALNYANVGLAMGSGTDIAKEASDIVLLDDSFRSIVNAVMWGRSLYQNIQRFILFQLTINVAALGIALLGPFIGVQFPLTVIQMLWINLIMDTFASLALATEPPRWEVMEQPPRKSSDFIISPAMTRGILGLGATFIVLLVGFLVLIQNDGTVTPLELSIFYATFILLQFWNLFNARVLGLKSSAFADLNKNRMFVYIAIAILIGTFAIVQFGGDIFRTVPLSLAEWGLILAFTSLVLWVGEIRRWLLRRGDDTPQQTHAQAIASGD
ncbi:MAG: calcium-translocating P-type ATPase, PMCA-type [bacterium]|nr:calcium-translocating P-type ATPase, PMCA-type [bacterium]